MNDETAGQKENKDLSRISIAIGDFKVELEGTHGNVEKLMGKPIYQFIEGLQDVLGEIPHTEQIKKETTPPVEYPPPVSKTSSLSEAIKNLLKSEWGTTPRTFSEIMKALETSGIYYSKSSSAGVLNHLVKSGALRRIGERGAFTYVLA